MDNKVDILGVNIDKLGIKDASEKIYSFLEDGGHHCVFTPNSEIIMAAHRDENFKKILNSADILTADGIGVVYASKILKNPITERAAGFDTAMELLKKMNDGKKSLYLFGSKPGVADRAAEKIKKMHPNIVISGCADGYFNAEKEKKIIDDINEKGPDVLFVCLGFPKQEKWIYEHKGKLNVKVMMGLGGSLDVIAGEAKRAPEIFQKLNMEWFYRLCKEPWRIGRMMDLPKFAVTVILKGKRAK